MSVEEIRELEDSFWGLWNKGKESFLAEVDGMVSLDVVFHGWSGPDYGLREFKQSDSAFFDAFPDIHFAIDEILVEGDKAAVRYTMTGTQGGVFRGVPPTNRKVALWGIDIHRVVDGMIVECWSRIDTYGWMQQLGALPTANK